MPYIKKIDRGVLDPLIDQLLKDLPFEAATPEDVIGPLNYVLTRIVMGFLKSVEAKPTYATLALFSGMLSHVGAEFYRRVVTPYEDGKIVQNGDLPEFIR